MIRLSLIFFSVLFICHLGYGQIQQGPSMISPELLEDNFVVFRLHAPCAKSVKLAGTMVSDYSEWEMMRNPAGVFELKLGPLEPDMYVYTFLVDSVRMIDPNNKIVVRDGAHIESRLMEVGS